MIHILLLLTLPKTKLYVGVLPQENYASKKQVTSTAVYAWAAIHVIFYKVLFTSTFLLTCPNSSTKRKKKKHVYAHFRYNIERRSERCSDMYTLCARGTFPSLSVGLFLNQTPLRQSPACRTLWF